MPHPAATTQARGQAGTRSTAGIDALATTNTSSPPIALRRQRALVGSCVGSITNAVRSNGVRNRRPFGKLKPPVKGVNT